MRASQTSARRGFTLIELAVAVLILVLAASVAIGPLAAGAPAAKGTDWDAIERLRSVAVTQRKDTTVIIAAVGRVRIVTALPDGRVLVDSTVGVTEGRHNASR